MMVSANLDFVRSLFSVWERGDFSSAEWAHPEIEYAMADGPSAGLAVLDTVDERLAGHYRLDAVRAHLLEMAGDTQGALEHYRAAAARTTSLPPMRQLCSSIEIVIPNGDWSGSPSNSFCGAPPFLAGS